MEQARQSSCHQRVNRLSVNSAIKQVAIKQVNVIIMGTRVRGSTDCDRVMEKGDYQV